MGILAQKGVIALEEYGKIRAAQSSQAIVGTSDGLKIITRIKNFLPSLAPGCNLMVPVRNLHALTTGTLRFGLVQTWHALHQGNACCIYFYNDKVIF